VGEGGFSLRGLSGVWCSGRGRLALCARIGAGRSRLSQQRPWELQLGEFLTHKLYNVAVQTLEIRATSPVPFRPIRAPLSRILHHRSSTSTRFTRARRCPRHSSSASRVRSMNTGVDGRTLSPATCRQLLPRVRARDRRAHWAVLAVRAARLAPTEALAGPSFRPSDHRLRAALVSAAWPIGSRMPRRRCAIVEKKRRGNGTCQVPPSLPALSTRTWREHCKKPQRSGLVHMGERSGIGSRVSRSAMEARRQLGGPRCSFSAGGPPDCSATDPALNSDEWRHGGGADAGLVHHSIAGPCGGVQMGSHSPTLLRTYGVGTRLT
jgi:hypothetical protein